MVGSIGEIIVAIALMVLLAGLLRWTFGSEPRGALPDETATSGSSRPSRWSPRARPPTSWWPSSRERVRVTVSRGVEGWRLLAFPTDADDARLVLRAL